MFFRPVPQMRKASGQRPFFVRGSEHRDPQIRRQFLIAAQAPCGVHEESALSRQFLMQVVPVCMRNRLYLGIFSCRWSLCA